MYKRQVSVCVPNSLHKKYTLMALSYGAHVLCEKPAALSRKDAVEMYEYARGRGKYLVACQSMRFTPDRLAAKKLLTNMPDIYYAEFSRIRRRGIPTWGKFHIKEISGGGALVDIGVHMLDSVLWLMNNPRVSSVRASVFRNHADEIGTLKNSGALTGNVYNACEFIPEEMDVEDFSAGTINFENGATVNFKAAWAANLPDEASIRLVNKENGILLPEGRVLSSIDSEEKLYPEQSKYPDEAFAGHFYLVDNFLEVLQGKAELIVKPEEIINVSTILELFYKSACLGKEIKVNELEEI